MNAPHKLALPLLITFCVGCQTLPAAVIPASMSAAVEIVEAPSQIPCGARDFLHQYTISMGSDGADYFALSSCHPEKCLGQAKISNITFQIAAEPASEGFGLSLKHQFELVADIELTVGRTFQYSQVKHQFRSSAVIDYACRNAAYQMPALKQKIDKELKDVVSQYETM
ncbi:MAG: hypothetical protein KJ930_09670 [Gammaproteobacteria bacterium]|jgi:hypothetical protein|nr:hypothetical protein [Gammaproteobacteria bacterium]MBU2179688.1 hypothetical protein [Gammaproteobacteria bacterium]MBU2223300.1 hypothetical protein [Gammaproteobacteria bacterium]MBU2277667.1 hypothetical protein [Gammaproteobacteria bacterium]MBU2428786.1 hypothetical protein [Gammaproteobacteria bacterium]